MKDDIIKKIVNGEIGGVSKNYRQNPDFKQFDNEIKESRKQRTTDATEFEVEKSNEQIKKDEKEYRED